MRKHLLAHRRQFAVFVAGGALCALLDVGLMQLLLATGVHFAAAVSAGFGAGLLLNYAFHARLTFAGQASGASMLRFGCVVALNYLTTLALVALFVGFGAPALAGKLVSLPLVAVNGFLLGKYWVFK